MLDKTVKKVSPDIFKAVEKEVLYFQNEFVGSDDLILQDDIFRVLEDIEDLSIIMFPVEDEEFCGFLFEYRGEKFIYINTFLPFEKQIFTAARNPEKGILYQINKHKVGERWQKRTKHVKLSNLKALIIDNYEMELLPEEKINKDLSFFAEVDVDAE
ncbi:MAG: hypothetical protein ABR547_09345 [Halanaerobium sp.]